MIPLFAAPVDSIDTAATPPDAVTLPPAGEVSNCPTVVVLASDPTATVQLVVFVSNEGFGQYMVDSAWYPVPTV